MNESGELVYIGDVHLDREDPAVEAFVSFLDGLAHRATRIVLLGDLFNLWIGDAGLEQPHQRAVLEKLAELRRRGVVVRYLEGNRDYRIGPCYTGTALDGASEQGIVERFAGRSLFAVHGDLVNPADRQYRAWRAFSRSAPVWWLYRVLPRRRRVRFAESLESRMRGTNLEFKSRFPEDEVRAYARAVFRRGHDALVLGHFHVEKHLSVTGGGDIFVLPEWKGSRRHLRISGEGETGFVDSVVS